MLKIRLQRVGRKNEPVFRIVITDSKNSTKSGRFLEILGSHDPRDKQTTSINGERIKYWLSKGAQLSGTLNNLLITKGIIDGKKINVLPKKTPIAPSATEVLKKEEVAPNSNEAPVETTETPVEEKAPEEAPVEEKQAEDTPAEEPKEVSA